MRALGAITGLSLGWALGACALALAPLAVHVLARGRARRIEFAGQRLLAEVEARGRRASRPRDLATLLLRAGALGCLALAFGGLAWSGPARGGGGRVVVVLDASASMSRIDAGRSVFERARDRAVERLREPRVELGAAIVARGAARALLPEMTSNLDALRGRVAAVEGTLERGDLGAALARAIGGGGARIVVYTDAQGGAALAGEAGVEVVDCEVRPWTDNLAVTDLEVDAEGRAVARLRRWGGGAGAVTIALEVDGRVTSVRQVVVAPGGAADVAFDVQGDLPAGAAIGVRIDSADGAAWDDVRFALAPGGAEGGAAIVTRSGAGARLLRAALNPFGDGAREARLAAPGEAVDEAMVWIVGAGAWEEGALDALASRLRTGARAVWIIDSAEAHDAARRLLERHGPADGLRLAGAFEVGGWWRLRASAGAWLDLGEGAPLVEEAETSARSPGAAPEGAVGLRFDDGAPALVRTPIGAGALITLHAPIEPGLSTIARTPALPILAPALAGAMQSAPARAPDALVGDAITLAPGAPISPGATLTDSLGRPVRIGASGALLVEALAAPGVVTVGGAGATAHVEARESEPARASQAPTIEEVGPAPASAATKDLGAWLLGVAALLLVGESLASRAGRRLEGAR